MFIAIITLKFKLETYKIKLKPLSFIYIKYLLTFFVLYPFYYYPLNYNYHLSNSYYPLNYLYIYFTS
jgi:hypothetical protein